MQSTSQTNNMLPFVYETVTQTGMKSLDQYVCVCVC
jgi:hypothetical protein